MPKTLLVLGIFRTDMGERLRRLSRQLGDRLARMILPVDPRPGVLLLNGTVGVGKTTVAEAIGDRLADAGVPGAVVDIDWLRRCWPAPDGDPFHLELALRNGVGRSERSVPLDVDLGEAQLSFGLGQLTFGLSNLALHLIENRLEGTRIDLKENVAFVNE